MKTLQVKEQEVIEVYKKSNDTEKSLLTKIFGEKTFKTPETFESIKNFEDACKKLKLKGNILPDVKMFPKKHQEALIAHAKLIIIAEAINEGWQPNWEDYNEQKWYPYFTVRGGFRFRASAYRYDNTYTCVGSRLCFKTKTIAEYIGKNFMELYKINYMLK